MRYLASVLLGFALSLAALPARALEWNPERFIETSEVQPGTIARAFTVWEGIEPTSFDVRIIGVLPNAVPDGDLVMIRLLGARGELTGVVAGMSGSPVYVGDRLLGAISYSFPFAKEPLGMVTPIRQMLDAANRAAPVQRSSLGLPVPRPRGDSAQPQNSGSFVPVTTPLMISGGSPEFLRLIRPLLEDYGMLPVQAGGGGVPAGSWTTRPLEPGSSIGVPMIRGDFEYAAVGTVTWGDGDQFLALGHPLLLGGAVEFPVSNAWIHATVPSIMNSFKIGSAGPPIGAVVQDRQAAVLLRVGGQAPSLPASVTLRGLESDEKKYRFEIIQNQYYTPLLLLLAVSQTLLAEGRTLGPTALAVRVEAEIEGHGRYASRDLLNSGSNPVEAVADALGPILQASAGVYGPTRVNRVSIEFDATEERRTAIVRRLRLPQRVVAPGESLEVELLLDIYGKPPETLRIPLRVPESAQPGALRVSVYDKAGYEAQEANRRPGLAPETLDQLLRLSATLPTHDELRLVLADPRPGVTLAGRELTTLPPTARSLLENDLVSGRVRPTTGSILFQSTLRTDYVIQGSQSAELWVSNQATVP